MRISLSLSVSVLLGLFTVDPLFAKALANPPSVETLARCTKPLASDPVLYHTDFKWGYSLDEMKAEYKKIYNSGRRLYNRAYYDPSAKSYVMMTASTENPKPIRLSPLLLKSIRQHIEISLQRHYADAVFFPDMGHSHFYIPVALKKELDKIDYSEHQNLFYEQLFANPAMKILYHTAEQLKVTDGEKMSGQLVADSYLQWRYYSRNVVGPNDGTDNISIVNAFPEKGRYNSLGEDGLPGYEYFGAGFNVSASKDGCFEFTSEGATYYFDLSMNDLPSDPNTPIEGDP